MSAASGACAGRSRTVHVEGLGSWTNTTYGQDRPVPQDDDRLVATAVRRVRNGDVLGALRLLQH